MKKTVHSKLICSYIFIGIVGFLFATAGGSHFVETYLEEEVGARLYDSAVGSPAGRHKNSSICW